MGPGVRAGESSRVFVLGESSKDNEDCMCIRELYVLIGWVGRQVLGAGSSLIVNHLGR